MNLEQFIDQFGYIAVLVGTFFEGETVLILAGFAASQAYMALSGVIAAAFIGAFLGDQVFFYLGRAHGYKIMKRFPTWRPRVEKAQRLLTRFQTPIMVGFRFMLGMRSITPFALGMSSVSITKFFLLNALGALLWAVLVGCAGYVFGQALELVLDDLKHYEHLVIALVALAGLTFWLIRFLLHRLKAHKAE